jgi:CYTH domain-containing protein
MMMCRPRVITKTRHILPLEKLLQLEAFPHSAFKVIEGGPSVQLEVDVFHGLFLGLLYVEVERPEGLTDDRWKNLPLPEWISNNEVTGMKGFSNRHLAESGKFPKVPDQFVNFSRK